MIKKLASAAFAVFLFSNWALAQQGPRTIFVVRHAEKATTAPDSPLNAAGEKRADCLAKTLKDAGIKQIYVTDAKRTQQTAAPLAKLLKVTPTILKGNDMSGLVRNLFYGASGNALVVGHSDTLPVIVARVQGGTVPAVNENEYDRLIVVTMIDNNGTPASTLHYCELGPSAPTPADKDKKTATPAKPAAGKKK